jgi:Uncharacterized protein conserved in bacteria
MIGVVADDITGANDIGIMFAKSGYRADVYSYDNFQGIAGPNGKPDVLVLDTDSRFDDAATAYRKVYQATKILQELGVERFYNKTCSVFRGNVGAEFDAMLDALGERSAAVVLGFPKNGRVTKNGIHYVHGKKLEDSEFRHDPVHPMTESNLLRILQAQTARSLSLVTHRTVEAGEAAVRAEWQRLSRESAYVLFDVGSQRDLEIIAKALYDCKVIGGSSALVEELASLDPKASLGSLTVPAARPGLGTLVVAGSLMPQTAAQIDHFKAHCGQVFELRTMDLLDAQTRESLVRETADALCERIRAGESVLLHASNDPAIVQATKSAGRAAGLSNTDVSQLVSGTLAETAYRVVLDTGLNRLVVAGGDTSASVCRKLGIRGMTVWKEIQPGLPSCITLTAHPMLIVLKSGSFGTAAFLEQAIAHLKEI